MADAPQDEGELDPITEEDEPDAIADEDYVAVPGALAHRSCVWELEDGATIDEDGTVFGTDGRARQLPVCQYKSFPVSAQPGRDPSPSADVPAPVLNGWIESASWVNARGIRYLSAAWNVPPAPSTARGQTIHMFPALESKPSDPQKIFQPVLTYGHWPVAQYWQIASWAGPYSSCGGCYVHSPYIQVWKGNPLWGELSGSNCGVNVCSSWSISITNDANGKTSTLNRTGVTFPMYWMFGAALETYDMKGCSDYPANASTTFDVTAYDTIWNTVYPAPWSLMASAFGCGEGIGYSGNKVTLYY